MRSAGTPRTRSGPSSRMAAVRRAAGHLDPEGQRARVGHHQPVAGGLGDHGRLGAVAAAQRRERAEPAVLLADHAVHGQRPLQAYAGRAQRLDDRHVGRESGLHVAGATSVEPALVHLRGERVAAAPGLRVARRYDVEVALQHQRRASRRPRRDRGQPERLVPLDLRAREPRVGASSSRSISQWSTSRPASASIAGGHLDHLDLGRRTGHRRHAHQRRQPVDERVLVEVVEDPLFGRGERVRPWREANGREAVVFGPSPKPARMSSTLDILGNVKFP